MRYTSRQAAALAALGGAMCATTACQAQSNVNVYGLLDLNVGASTHAAGDGGTVARVGSGGMNTSRLGFKGSEDLGAGLKAVFQLEAAVLGDTGGTDAALFKRQANVGLEGRYGRIVFGRSFTTVYDFMIRYDPMGFAPFYSWGTSGGATGANKYGMTTGFDNMVKYVGKAGPVTVGASYGAGETPGSPADNAKGAVGIDYAAGPWSAVATWERSNGATVAATGRRDANTVWHLGTMYTAGPYKLQLAARDYRLGGARANAPDVRATLYWTGGSWQVNAADTLILALYVQDVRNVPRAVDADPRMVVVSLRHALSRRTDLYVTAADAKAKHGQLVGISRDDPGFADTQRGLVVGMQHRF
jgi:predicted porin